VKDRNITTWTAAMIERLSALAPTGQTSAVMAEIMNREFGLRLTRYSLIGKMYREGIKSGNPYRLRTPGTKKKRTKVTAPPMVPDDVPFLPPVELVIEYVPAARMPKTFLEAGQFECQNFLPDQDDKPAPERLVCANPVNFASRFRFCAACGEHLTSRATRVVLKAESAKHNALRKRSALTGAML